MSISSSPGDSEEWLVDGFLGLDSMGDERRLLCPLRYRGLPRSWLVVGILSQDRLTSLGVDRPECFEMGPSLGLASCTGPNPQKKSESEEDRMCGRLFLLASYTDS